MNEKKSLEKWGKIREKGRVHFLWVYGVLIFGLPLGIIASIFMDLFDQFLINKFTFPSSLFTTKFLRGLIIDILIFLTAGYCYAMYLWNYFEKRWKNRKL